MRSLELKRLTAMDLLLEQARKPSPPEIERKQFKAKYPLSKLDDYSKEPPANFWDGVKFRSWEEAQEIKGGINASLLEELALKVGYPDLSILQKVCKDLKEGARIGVSEEGRVSSTATNAASAIEHGQK